MYIIYKIILRFEVIYNQDTSRFLKVEGMHISPMHNNELKNP